MKWLIAVLWLPLVTSVLCAEEDGRSVAEITGKEVSYAQDIAPILRKNCLACHNESETEGELILESGESILAGGDSGPAIVPGNAEESLLFQLATHRTEPVMPPVDNDVGAKPLSAEQLGLLKLWINQGAKFDASAGDTAIVWQPVAQETAPVHAIDVSADGRWLAAGRGNQVVVYAVPFQREVQQLVDASIEATHPQAAHLDVVQSVAFSPDQQWLVTGGFRCVKVWRRTSTGPAPRAAQPKAEQLPADEAEVIDAQLSEDGSRALRLVKTEGGVVAELYALPEMKKLQVLDATVFTQATTEELTRSVGLRKERSRVAQADVESAKKRKTDDENHVKKTTEELKKAQDEVPKRKEALDKAQEALKQQAAELATQQEQLTAAKEAASSPDAADDAKKRAADLEKAIADKQKAVEKAQAEEKKKQQEFDGAEKVVVLAVDAKDRAEKMVVRRTEELQEAEQEAAHFAERVQQAEKTLAAEQERIQAEPVELKQVRFLDNGWEFAVWSHDGRYARFASATGAMLEVAAAGAPLGSWELVKSIGDPANGEVFEDRVTALAFSPDGALLATGGGSPSRSGEVQLWSTEDWSLRAKIENVHSDVVYDLHFSPQADVLASCASDRMVKLVDLETLKPVKTLEGHTGHVLGVAWRADGRTLVTSGADKVVKVWDAKEGTQKKTISGFKSEVTDVCFLGLEDRFVFGVGTGQVESRDSNGGGKPGFAGFKDYVHRVVASIDGKVIAAAGEDRVVRVWDPQGKMLMEFP